MSKTIIPIRGMTCRSCELLIEKEIKKVPGVNHVSVNHRTGEARVDFTGSAPNKNQLEEAVRSAGYNIGKSGSLPWLSRNAKDYYYLALAAALLWVIYGAAKALGILNFNFSASNDAGVWIALVVGLVAGVSTCMALVGGLVLAFSSRHAELHPEATTAQKFRPHLYFNAGRVVGFFVLGGVIGGVGSVLKPSPAFLGLFTILVGGVMLILGLKLVEIFPRVAGWQITLPKSIAKTFGLAREAKEYSHRHTFMAGSLSFFLPCGFTQAMQLYAVSMGSFWGGATVMGLFAIGTAPGLLTLGGLSSIFKGRRARVFFATAGLAVILLGWLNIANGRQLLFSGAVGAQTSNVTSNIPAQVVRMAQGARGYSPNILYVKKGVPVKWIINSTNSFTCATSLVVPSLGINASLRKGENIITFTPTEVRDIPFSCSMGMYRGRFIITE